MAAAPAAFGQQGSLEIPKARRVPARNLMVQAADYRVHATPREECRVLVIDSKGRLVTLGIASNGSDTLNATRQFLSIGRYADEHWTRLGKVSNRDGYVYFPAAAADSNGGVWIAWSEFNEIEQNWDVYARHFDGSSLGPIARVSSNRGPDMRPAIAIEPDGNPIVVWEAGANGTFQIMAARYRDGVWREEAVTSSAESNFRPFLAVDKQGVTWIAWDRYVGGDYDVYLRSSSKNKWGDEIAFFASAEDEQRPTLRIAPDNTVWVQSGKRVAGLREGKRYNIPPDLQDSIARLKSLEEFQIGPKGRFWFFEMTQGFNPGTRYQPGRGALTTIVQYDGKNAPAAASAEMLLGYRAPVFDAEGRMWNASDYVLYWLFGGIVPPPAETRVEGVAVNGPVAELKTVKPPPPHRPHSTVEIDGQQYTLFYGEQHTHLREHPTSRLIESWVDRFYTNAARSGVLDFAAVSEHDWVYMTNSKYMVEQGYVSVLSKPGEFQAFSGWEWSGEDFTRRRYGDRTIVLAHDYSPVFRITDPESNTPAKLHRKLASIGAIDWAHHVGAPFAVMDWTTHDPEIEPVMEMTSGHGVYETYDRAHAVPVWLTKEPVGKTSIQDGLGMGKRFGLVGSSDSHSGLSRYEVGMLGIYAKSLSRADILDAFRHRRTFAIRGGEPVFLDLRVNGKFMGAAIPRGDGHPRLKIAVEAPSPIEKVEIIRNGQYIYSHSPMGQTRETRFEYQDTAKAPAGAYYYIRVWMAGDKYAWSSPVWLD